LLLPSFNYFLIPSGANQVNVPVGPYHRVEFNSALKKHSMPGDPDGHLPGLFSPASENHFGLG
jgi:hypothetical protein